MSEARAIVPCNGCRACCQHELVMLSPEDDDVLENYVGNYHLQRVGPGEFAPVLNHQKNGDCVYLGATGCSIWDRAPSMCRGFDCRLYAARLVARVGRREVRKAADEVIRAGLARAKSLPR